MEAAPRVNVVEVRQVADSRYKIKEGAVYEYTCHQPSGRFGAKYRVDRFIQDVPSYQWKVLVECLTGPDAGIWFTVSPSNFSYRYVEVSSPPQDEEAADVRREMPGVQETARS